MTRRKNKVIQPSNIVVCVCPSNISFGNIVDIFWMRSRVSTLLFTLISKLRVVHIVVPVVVGRESSIYKTKPT